MKRFLTVSSLLFALSSNQALAADLIETASTSATFKTFLAAAKTSGIAEKLKTDGPYTVFAPSDSAFKKLPTDTLDSLMKDKEKLAGVLAHHVIPGKIMVAEVKPGPAKTMQGDVVTLKSDNGKVTVDNANVTQSDLIADNGVIHEIDTVILPAK